MDRFRWTELALFALALSVLAWAARTRRSSQAAFQAAVAEQGTLRFSIQQLTAERNRLQAWARMTRADSSMMLTGLTRQGTATTIRPAELKNPLILYSMNPECSSCIENLPYLQRISSQGACGTQVVGVLTAPRGSMREIPRADSLFPILERASGSAWSALPLSSGPTTIVLGNGGRLEGWWSGVLSSAVQADIERRLASYCQHEG